MGKHEGTSSEQPVTFFWADQPEFICQCPDKCRTPPRVVAVAQTPAQIETDHGITINIEFSYN